MTLQDLKDNRTEIIAEIQGLNYNVTETMAAMVKWLGFNGLRSTDVISYVKEVVKLENLSKYEPIDISASNRMAEINRQNAIANLPSSMR